MKTVVKKDICRRVIALLFIAVILANIKFIFTNCDIDSEYAMAMSYRMLRGDHMFIQMWEPHQTSAFLGTFLLGIFTGVTGSTTGSAVFLQICGVAIQMLIGFLLYRFLKQRIDVCLAQLMVIFFLAVRPKNLVMPEFSNMQIWFSVLLFLCLLLYFETGKRCWLILAGVSLCLEIISYPSCLIVFLIVLILLRSYGKKSWRDVLLFMGICAVSGTAYVGFFVSRLGLKTFVQSIGYIVAADSTHGVRGGYYSGIKFFRSSGSCFLELGISFLLALIVNLVVRKWMSGKRFVREYNFRQTGIQLFPVCYVIVDCLAVLIYRERYAYILLFLLFFCGGVFGLRYCNAAEKRIVLTGMLLSVGSFFAVLMLTNLDFCSVVQYLILAVMVSFLPISRVLERSFKKSRLCKYLPLFCFCFLLIFREGILLKTSGEMPSNLLDVGGIIKGGPAMGIVEDYMGAYMENSTIEEMGQLVREGDRLLIVTPEKVSTLGYLYKGTTVSAASTICTPTYDEKLLQYWEQNPEKRPNLIMVECWYGELKMEEDSWIMQWIEREFQPNTYTDGKYWRYYRLEE